MSDDKDSVLINWVIKAIVIGIIVGALYWFFSPQLRCERAYSDTGGLAAVTYCMRDNNW